MQQIKETERKRSGKGKRETQNYKKYTLVCKVMYAGILRHALPITPEKPDVRAAVQLFLIHSVEKLQLKKYLVLTMSHP